MSEPLEAKRRPELGGPDAPVLVVAGATGTGKSTLCGWLAERGAFVIDADRVGHEMLLRTEVIEELVGAFGPEILDQDGQVDRRQLGSRVFADARALAGLNAIVHPPLVAEIERRIAALRESRATRLVVVDAALHYQFQPRLVCDAVLMTRVERAEQVRRIVARDGLGEDEALARIERQGEVEASLGLADAVLDTAGPPEEVRWRLLDFVDETLGTRLREGDPPAALREAGRKGPPSA